MEPETERDLRAVLQDLSETQERRPLTAAEFREAAAVYRLLGHPEKADEALRFAARAGERSLAEPKTKAAGTRAAGQAKSEPLPAPPNDHPATDQRWSLESHAECRRRREMLSLPHVRPLTDFVQRVRRDRSRNDVPDFDPCDGGTRARALLLFRSPSPMPIETGFVSRNNPDPTADNVLALFRQARLPREESVLWNVVPWPVPNDKVTGKHLDDARPYLKELLALLPRLRAVVLIGNEAHRVQEDLAGWTTVPCLRMAMPSPRVFNVWPDKRREAELALQQVAAILDLNTEPSSQALPL